MSRLRRAGLLAALSCLVLAPAGFAATKDGTAKLMAHAKYVALGYDLGDRFVEESETFADRGDIHPEDRRALAGLRALIEKMDRHVITVRREQADLFIAVRTGRRVAVGGTVSPGGVARFPGSAPRGVAAVSEVSSAEDMLSVYEARGNMLLWREKRAEGLSGSSPRLFEDLKAEFDRAAKLP
jgi:hypothetical protein